MKTVTVTRYGDQRYVVRFSQLPDDVFGPWSMAETIRDLRVSALLEADQAKWLVLDAHENGSATCEVG